MKSQEPIFTTKGFPLKGLKVKTNYTESDMMRIKLELLFEKLDQ